MRELSIARAHWAEFVDGFGRRHSGWLIDVEAVSFARGYGDLLTHLTLTGLRYDPQRDEVSVEVETESPEIAVFLIRRPARVACLVDEEGLETGLEVVSVDRSICVRFRSPIRPDMVDLL
jgi:hypothetical protein